MISDISAVIYEYIAMDKPMILINNNCDFRHDMPADLNAMKYATIYDGHSNILEVIKASFEDKDRTSKYRELLNNCFYFNDGKSAERATNFLQELGSK